MPPDPALDLALDNECINTLRFLSVDAVQKANSGHPGMPMGAASMAYVLWTRFLKYNPATLNGSTAIASCLPGTDRCCCTASLHLTGYDLCYNRPGAEIVNHFTYGIVSDGDLMEGVSSEAASLAGHLKLGKLIYLYDDNHVTLSAGTDLTFTEDRARRFEAYGWHIQSVADGNDLAAIDRALRAARGETERPSLIVVRTHIGYDSPHKQDSFESHGSPLGADEVRLTKHKLGWPVEPPFYIPEQAREHFREAIARGKLAETEWRDKFSAYARAFPDLANAFQQVMRGELPDGWDRIFRFPCRCKGSRRPASPREGDECRCISIASIDRRLGGFESIDPYCTFGTGRFEPVGMNACDKQGA
jgi:transketolase